MGRLPLSTTWVKRSLEPTFGYWKKRTIANLSHGEYTFEVSARYKSGEWSAPFQYTFSISPPWWHTWWARLVYIVALLFLIRGAVYWRTRNLKIRQQELECEVDSATKEIREKKR